MEENCDICYQIKCKKCGWIANPEETVLVQKEIITQCPLCGWAPKDELIY